MTSSVPAAGWSFTGTLPVRVWGSSYPLRATDPRQDTLPTGSRETSPVLPIMAPMDLGLADKVAIVCAASRGMGRATAAALVQEGARIAMSARHEGELH